VGREAARRIILIGRPLASHIASAKQEERKAATASDGGERKRGQKTRETIRRSDLPEPGVLPTTSQYEALFYDKTTEAMKRFQFINFIFFCFFCYLLICDWSSGQNRPLDQSQISK
jgi:hypothetical protein